MADARCPMCGKSNPAERDTCQYCQARLKPFQVSSPADETETPAGNVPGPKKKEGSETGTPDWLQSLRHPDQAGQLSQSSEESASDWLGGLREQSSMEGELESADEQPLWSPEEQASSGEFPDWLNRLEATKPDSGPVEQPEWFAKEQQDHKPPEGELPDWLRGSASTGEEQPPSETQDWLSSAPEVPTLGETPSLGETPPEAQPELGGLPDWLSTEEPTAPAPVPASAEPDQSGLPDWLIEGKEGSLERPAEQPAEQAAETHAAGELPDWLAAMAPTSEPAPVKTGPFEEPPEETAPPQPQPGEIEVPDWMASFMEPAESDQAAQLEQKSTASAPEAEPAAGSPDWLTELEASFPEMPVEMAGGAPAAGAVQPFTSDEMGEGLAEGELPGWLTEVSAEEAISETGVPEEQPSELTPASLPGWLEAMRPAEVPAAGEGPVEGAGPLTGLRGVLPAEPDIAIVGKPPIYTVKLQVSDAERSHADLLVKQIKQEGEAQPVPGRPVFISQHIMRLVIAAVLILSILLPLITSAPQKPEFLPDVETLDASNLIGGVTSGTPVLLAVDYEPGLSGEMDAATGAVLDFLMIKGAFLTVVSTVPTGPVQAEHLIADVNRINAHQYQSPGSYVNLGFIPGGPTGLLSFAQDPQGILPAALNGDEVWQAGPLAGINSLANFALVIVATDNPNTARAWIEQVQPNLVDIPMIMVISAQAEPIVRPYYETNPRQIYGLVTGLVGGATFEGSLGRSGNANNYWVSFRTGMLVAVLLIVLVGGVNVGLAWLSQDKDHPKREVKA